MLKITSRASSEQQVIISFSRFIQPFIIEPQSSIDIARNRIPDLGAERQFRTACNGISITGGFGQRVDTHVPEIVPHIIAVEFKFISHVVTGAHAEGRVGAILLLQLRIQFFVQNSYLFITIHLLYSREKPPYQSIQWLL
mgnify:CR=1 FL=1